MPELPEVETVCRGIAARIVGRQICAIEVRRADLRWPVPVVELQNKAVGAVVEAVRRRGKYALIVCTNGCVGIHLGMSGSLRWVAPTDDWLKHDHAVLAFADSLALRFHDPRRFGALFWADSPCATHPLLTNLGVEPLAEAFQGDFLFEHARLRKTNIKNLLMDARIVVGVGNIYANEALFLAGIHPLRPANTLARSACQRLVSATREILAAAIDRGGTTIRNFRNSDGNLGYFQMDLRVYHKQGSPCSTCNTPIQMVRSGGRSTFFCPVCQH
ncbi:MAG: bifunctional DNA-formamidopyrimidine glycosylase/DNA-(apurinic or apyrimidinic site) lyase [Magnetococcales bacterium]|nr:bifunctional DNA-formamidopyrimidine glycosylase/DNA-(apurinic or apyrimidinic site) lyase [Magnetococcales bacterium]